MVPRSQKVWLKGKVGQVKFVDNNLDENNLVTFICALKNRPNRIRYSMETIVTEESLKYAKFMIVEDQSDNLVDLDVYPHKDSIEHYVVNTGQKWNKAKLLNFGIKRTNTPLFVMWDADILFPDNFMYGFIDLLKKIDFNKYLLTINMFQTHTIRESVPGQYRRSHRKFDYAEPYSSMWVYDTEKVKQIKGYDESMFGWGYEELDIKNRLSMKYGLSAAYSHTFSKLFVLHYSHPISLRGNKNNQKKKKENKENNN